MSQLFSRSHLPSTMPILQSDNIPINIRNGFLNFTFSKIFFIEANPSTKPDQVNIENINISIISAGGGILFRYDKLIAVLRCI
jgi:hypothetical protein